MMPSLLRHEINRSRGRLLGIMDYRYAPLALGDTMTWLTKLQVEAHTHGLKKIEILIAVPPGGWQSAPQINSYNHAAMVQNIFPAFLCAPMVNSVRFYASPSPAPPSQRILGALLARTPTWPHLSSHFRRHLDYHSHLTINAFFRRHKWIPKLRSPKEFRSETEALTKTYFGGRSPCIINIRQSSFTNTPDRLLRDSPVGVWYRFLRRAHELRPEVVFVLTGDFGTWDRETALLPNVVVPRALGYGLGHELTLLLDGAPFLGSNSGFSAVATFSDVPYGITRFQYGATGYMKGIEMEHGEEHYPFASEHQWLSWVPETEEVLLDLFAKVWGARDGVRLAN
jgi:hypothetical protein